MNRKKTRKTHIHKPMRHRPDNSDATTLLQRKRIIMILQQNNRLPIQLTGKINSLLSMDELVPLRCRSSIVGVLEEAHFELRTEHTGYRRVDDFNIELAGIDQVDDRFEVANLVLDDYQLAGRVTLTMSHRPFRRRFRLGGWQV